MKYLFGPVNSRRLGLSLGVDLVPSKTCSLNCVYCECGSTTALTDRIGEYVPTSDVVRELDGFLSPSPRLDVVTFSGSGEPTLHGGIGDVIEFLKERYPKYPVAVLTNGTLLWKSGVRRSILRADTVVPSLDAVSEEVFAKMLRPAPGITAGKTVRGLIEFGAEYRGSLIIEVFIIPGLNDGAEELAGIRDVCLKIQPRSVQLNRLDRPGAEHHIGRATDMRLAEIRDFMQPLNVEIVGEPQKKTGTGPGGPDIDDLVLSTLRRRPSTLDDLEKTLGIGGDALAETLERLRAGGRIEAIDMERGRFYQSTAT